MDGNIKKIRDRQLAAPLQSETLQDLVKNELATKKHTASEGLLWLTRGLDFTRQGLSHNLSNPSAELSNSFREAYTGTLKPHHSFMVKPIFSAAMSATPYRKDFYAKLGSNEKETQTKCDKEMKALEKIVGILNGFMKTQKW
ncbi:hypothetical protein LTS18_013842 [Coniosporium uncinatum]|uniref:Uncharacterized protein n=1 Tax=Coniosporium uncinatum TaxID=93489 RepID=A0ACC3CW93_9PEZI|nr:hypothetical protein LTS18_013842 [Coniosporium uncinatum]